MQGCERGQRDQRGSNGVLLSRGSIDNDDAESEDVVAVLGSAYVLKCERGSNGQGSAVARFRSWAHEVEFTARLVQSRAFAWAAILWGSFPAMVRSCRLRVGRKSNAVMTL
jgi:hypothetical protein